MEYDARFGHMSKTRTFHLRGQVIELPTHVLIGKARLTHCLRTDFVQSRDQSGYDTIHELIGLQIQWWVCQTRVTSAARAPRITGVVDGPLAPADSGWFCRRIALQCVQLALDDRGCAFFLHAAQSREQKLFQAI